ncbi:MAG: cation-translocating P-type ATPase [Kiritimatiellae bacterium]|nr:cation-translocating P-type ATPase [Kiritimatiellia bacterium]
MSSPIAKVIRDGKQSAIPSTELVTGDLVILESGDHIPADSRVVWHTSNFSVQEASLTGESTPVAKISGHLDGKDIPLADRTNMVFMGTSAVSGKAKAFIVETGMKTELGKIAGMIQGIERESTPLQKKLEEFGKWIVYLCIGLVAIVFLLQWLRGGKLIDAFLTSVSLAVAAIPEGLPAVVTIALALGVQRMVKRNALIRKLPSVETLGCATVICSDKTGTLTKNEMTVQAMVAGGKQFSVTGTGYEPSGEFIMDGKAINPVDYPELKWTLLSSILCNGAELIKKDGSYRIVGDPTEGALLTAAEKAGLKKNDAEKEYIFVDEIPFDSDRKMMTIIRQKGDKTYAFVKGAPDILLKNCSQIEAGGQARAITNNDFSDILKANGSMAAQALRVLAIAYRTLDKPYSSYKPEEIEKNLIFAGLVAMIDPPREEAKRAVEACKSAGIRTVMITGDHRDTAVAIAKQLGFFTEDSIALTGEELDRLSDDELLSKVEKTPVYARVSPENKLRIVKAWKKLGHVVAMTGDGVNDAPAVKEADIGVAMGITGTDVTKEVSDMVVTDDNFASIVAAVEEGRGIYDNIQKFIHYLLSCNVGEIMVMFISSLVGLPVPLLPAQLLWVNLVTDGLPALALGVDPINKNIMKRKPRKADSKVIDGKHARLMVGQGFVIAVCALSAFCFIYFLENRYSLKEFFTSLFTLNIEHLKQMLTIPEAARNELLAKARTVGFVVLAFCQDFQSYNCRNQTESLFKIGLFSNKRLIGATIVSMTLNTLAIYCPFFNTILKTVPLTLVELLIVIVMSSIPLWVMEAVKFAKKSSKQPENVG